MLLWALRMLLFIGLNHSPSGAIGSPENLSRSTDTISDTRLVPVIPSEVNGSNSFRLNETVTIHFASLLSGTHHAKFTVDRGDQRKKFLFTPNLLGYLEKARCTNDTIEIQIRSEHDFQQVRNDWGWVNQHPHNSIVLITHSQDCDVGADDPHDIQPWLVQDAKFHDKNNTAVFSAVAKDWHAVVPDWRFVAKSEGLDSTIRDGNHAIQRRSKQGSINLATDFSGLGIPIGGDDLMDLVTGGDAIGALTCDPCRTTGHIGFDIDISPNIFKNNVKGNLKFTTRDLGAVLQTNLQLWDSITTLAEADHEIYGIVPEGLGIYVKNLVSIGPTFIMGYRFGVEKNPGLFALSAGLNVSIADSEVDIDILHPHKIKKDGWTVEFEPLEPGMSRNLSLDAKIGPYLSFSMTGNFLGLGGFETGMTYTEPKLDIRLTGDGSECSSPRRLEQGTRAVGMGIGLEHQMYAFAGASGPKGLENVVGTDTKAAYTTVVQSLSTKLLEGCVTVHASEITSPLTLPTPQVTSFVPRQDIVQKVEEGIETAAAAVTAAIPTLSSLATKIASEVVSVATNVEAKASSEVTQDVGKATSLAMAAESTVKSGLDQIGDFFGNLF